MRRLLLLTILVIQNSKMGVPHSKEIIVALLLPSVFHFVYSRFFAATWTGLLIPSIFHFVYAGYVRTTWTQRPQSPPTPTEISEAAEVAQKESSFLRTEVEDLRREKSARIQQHEATLSAKDQQIERLERLLNHEYKIMEKETYKNEGKQKRLVREKKKLENDKDELMEENNLAQEKIIELNKEIIERSNEQIQVLAEQQQRMSGYLDVLNERNELQQTLEERTALNANANKLIDEQKERIKRLEEMPKPYWVFDERRLWGNGGKLEHESCVIK